MKKVTCLCPTYGRFAHLRDSISCFLHQTWDNKELLILNDAPKPVRCDFPQITVVNKEDRYETLGHKRQALLEMAESDVVTQWDDDDIYLPWHIEMNMSQWGSGWMVKPNKAFYIRGRRGDRMGWRGTISNWLEAMTLFDRDSALELGGYTPDVSGQTIRMIKRFKREGFYKEYEPNPTPSFVFRFADGHYHVQCGDGERFAKVNTDFGNEPLKPRKLDPFYDIITANIVDYAEEPTAAMDMLGKWVTSPLS